MQYKKDFYGYCKLQLFNSQREIPTLSLNIEGLVSSSMNLTMIETNYESLIYIFEFGKEQANIWLQTLFKVAMGTFPYYEDQVLYQKTNSL